MGVLVGDLAASILLLSLSIQELHVPFNFITRLDGFGAGIELLESWVHTLSRGRSIFSSLYYARPGNGATLGARIIPLD